MDQPDPFWSAWTGQQEASPAAQRKRTKVSAPDGGQGISSRSTHRVLACPNRSARTGGPAAHALVGQPKRTDPSAATHRATKFGELMRRRGCCADSARVLPRVPQALLEATRRQKADLWQRWTRPDGRRLAGGCSQIMSACQPKRTETDDLGRPAGDALRAGIDGGRACLSRTPLSDAMTTRSTPQNTEPRPAPWAHPACLGSPRTTMRRGPHLSTAR
jgi:hypothetical protein